MKFLGEIQIIILALEIITLYSFGLIGAFVFGVNSYSSIFANAMILIMIIYRIYEFRKINLMEVKQK